MIGDLAVLRRLPHFYVVDSAAPPNQQPFHLQDGYTGAGHVEVCLEVSGECVPLPVARAASKAEIEMGFFEEGIPFNRAISEIAQPRCGSSQEHNPKELGTLHTPLDHKLAGIVPVGEVRAPQTVAVAQARAGQLDDIALPILVKDVVDISATSIVIAEVPAAQSKILAVLIDNLRDLVGEITFPAILVGRNCKIVGEASCQVCNSTRDLVADIHSS